MKKLRPHSRYSANAASLLGGLIRAARLRQGLTAESVAERAGISRPLLRRIENGDLGVSLGAALETAVVVGVPLFDEDPTRVTAAAEATDSTLRLLPKSARRALKAVKDDF